MLGSPVVVGPVSPCNTGVRVQGQLPGAQLDVYAVVVLPGQTRSRHVGSAVVASADAFVSLAAGARLFPGEHVTVDQRTSSDFGQGVPASLAVEVTAEPRAGDLAGLFAGETLLECGTCLWLEGVFPGASVSLQLNNDPPLLAETQGQRVKFSLPAGQQLSTGDTLVASQTACGLAGSPVSIAAPVSQVRSEWPVAAPSVETPLVKCQAALRLDGVLPGATVVVEHNGEEERACFGYRHGVFWLRRRLEASDTVRVHQEFRGCELVSEGESHTAVDDVPAPPFVLAPVCEGDRLIRLAGLVPGAMVELAADGQHLCFFGAPEPAATFGVPPLLGTKELTVRQSACDGDQGTWSGWSAPRRVRSLGPQSTPEIVEPLIEGGVVVGVRGVKSGALVQIVSPLGVIGEAYGNGDVRLDVPLCCPLVRDDPINLQTFRCGKKAVGPGAVRVGPGHDLPPPNVRDPACDCGGSVLVEGVTPGAVVEVYRLSGAASVLVGSRWAGAEAGSVDVPPQRGGEQLQARQRIGQQRSGVGAIATVVNPPHWLYEPPHQPSNELERTGAFRLCQLTRDSDPAGRPHAGPTTGYGINGTDLGVPVDHGGALYLFFGDEAVSDWDPTAWSTTSDPDELEDQAPDLHWILNSAGRFQWLSLDGEGLGNFEVPTGGFSYDGRLYLFIAKDKLGDFPDWRMTSSRLAVLDDQQWDFHPLLFISSTVGAQIIRLDPDGTRHVEPYPGGRWMLHISPTVVRNADWPGLPASSGDGLLMFGSASYRAVLDATPTEQQLGNVYLAWAPLTPGVVPPHAPILGADQWQFFAGLSANGTPSWQTLSAGPPTPLLPPGPWGPRKLGEISAAWYPSLRRWILTGSFQAEINVARQPWGPWTSSDTICDAGRPDRDAGNSTDSFTNGNVTYAPYLIRRWQRWDRSLRTATVYFTLSGWDDRPGKVKYQPQLIRSTVKCWP
jgi:hypothetical protein